MFSCLRRAYFYQDETRIDVSELAVQGGNPMAVQGEATAYRWLLLLGERRCLLPKDLFTAAR